MSSPERTQALNGGPRRQTPGSPPAPALSVSSSTRWRRLVAGHVYDTLTPSILTSAISPGVRPHWLRTGSRSRGVRAVRQLLVSMLPPAEPEPPALLLARGLRPQNRAVQVGTGGRTGRSVQVDLRVRRPQVRHVERLVTVVIVIIDHSSRGYVSGDGWRRRSATSSLSERSADRHRKGSTTIDDRRSTSMPVGLVTCAFALLAVSGSVSNRVHTEEAGRCPMHLSGPRPGHRDLPSWGQPA